VTEENTPERKSLLQKLMGNIKLVVVVLAAFIVLSLAGFGTAKVLMHRSAAKDTEPPVVEAGPLYDAGEFTVNIAGSDGRRYLRTRITFELADEKLEKEIEEKQAIWQDKIVLVLSSKGIEEMDVQNREAIKKELLGNMVSVFGSGKVKNLYFTSFLIQ